MSKKQSQKSLEIGPYAITILYYTKGIMHLLPNILPFLKKVTI